VKDVELGGVLGEDLGESKLLDGAPSIIWGVEGDVGRCRGGGISWRRFDSEEALRYCRSSLRWAQAQVDLEKIVGFLSRRGPCGRVVHGLGFCVILNRRRNVESKMGDDIARWLVSIECRLK
jgi:hypothetical protein